MIHEVHCRRCNRKLLEPTRVSNGEMDDISAIPLDLFIDEENGHRYKTCPHCGARNGFREHAVPGRGAVLLQDGLLE